MTGNARSRDIFLFSNVGIPDVLASGDRMVPSFELKTWKNCTVQVVQPRLLSACTEGEICGVAVEPVCCLSSAKLFALTFLKGQVMSGLSMSFGLALDPSFSLAEKTD